MALPDLEVMHDFENFFFLGGASSACYAPTSKTSEISREISAVALCLSHQEGVPHFSLHLARDPGLSLKICERHDVLT